MTAVLQNIEIYGKDTKDLFKNIKELENSDSDFFEQIIESLSQESEKIKNNNSAKFLFDNLVDNSLELNIDLPNDKINLDEKSKKDTILNYFNSLLENITDEKELKNYNKQKDDIKIDNKGSVFENFIVSSLFKYNENNTFDNLKNSTQRLNDIDLINNKIVLNDFKSAKNINELLKIAKKNDIKIKNFEFSKNNEKIDIENTNIQNDSKVSSEESINIIEKRFKNSLTKLVNDINHDSSHKNNTLKGILSKLKIDKNQNTKDINNKDINNKKIIRNKDVVLKDDIKRDTNNVSFSLRSNIDSRANKNENSSKIIFKQENLNEGKNLVKVKKDKTNSKIVSKLNQNTSVTTIEKKIVPKYTIKNDEQNIKTKDTNKQQIAQKEQLKATNKNNINKSKITKLDIPILSKIEENNIDFDGLDKIKSLSKSSEFLEFKIQDKEKELEKFNKNFTLKKKSNKNENITLQHITDKIIKNKDKKDIQSITKNQKNLDISSKNSLNNIVQLDKLKKSDSDSDIDLNKSEIKIQSKKINILDEHNKDDIKIKIQDHQSTKVENVNIHTFKHDSKLKHSTEIRHTLNTFAQDFKEQVENYKPPIMKVKMQLSPKGLGDVDVTMINRGNNLHITVNSNPTTIAIFSQNQNEFKNSLVGMGFSELNMSFNENGKNRDSNQNQKNKTTSILNFEEENIEDSFEMTTPIYI